MRTSRTYFLIFILLLTSLLSPSGARGEEAGLELSISDDLIRKFLQIPISDVDAITGFSVGASLSGTAQTTGRAVGNLVPAVGGAILQLDFFTRSHLSPVASQAPAPRLLPRLQVDARLAGVTDLRAVKQLHLTPSGIATTPTTVVAGGSSLAFADAQAQGPLSRFLNRSGTARRQAEKKFWGSKAQSEWDSTAQAVAKTTRKTDAQFQTLVDNLNRDYRNTIWEPLFFGGRIPATLRVSSSADAIYLELVAKEPLPADVLGGKPQLPPGSQLGLRLHESMFNRYLDQLTRREQVFDEADLEEFFIMNGIPVPLAHYPDGAARLQLRFCKENSVQVQFRDEVIYLKLCTQQLRFEKETLSHAELEVSYAVHTTPGGELLLVRSPSVRASSGGGEALSKKFRAVLEERLGRLFPHELKLGRRELPPTNSRPQALGVNWATADKGWLALSWTLQDAPEVRSVLRHSSTTEQEPLGLAPADRRYFLYIFGAQDEENRFENTHSWATLVEYNPSQPLDWTSVSEGHSRSFVEKSISHLSRTRIVDSLRFGPERSRNRDYLESFHHITQQNNRTAFEAKKMRIGIWGPFEVQKSFPPLFEARRKALASGKIWYQVQDFATRIEKHFLGSDFPEAAVCFHALSDVTLPVDPRGFLVTGIGAGFKASAMVAWHFFPWYEQVWTSAGTFWTKPIEPLLKQALEHFLHIDYYRQRYGVYLADMPLVPVENAYCRTLEECRAKTGRVLQTQLLQ